MGKNRTIFHRLLAAGAALVFGLLDSGVFVRGSARQRQALNARARREAVTT